mmetsp:Transcript_21876/g.33925  ORF Transcript_21876/g.33925 Transcript_21876/m.33925 type:complete len:198 (+) Transcript_21876:1156-1749(+)
MSSVGQVSGNLSLCTGNGTIIYNKTLGVVNEYQIAEYGLAGTSTYNILKSIDPLLFSCYYSLFEYYIALELYGKTATDYQKLLYNLAHNLGSIYDLTEEAVYKIIDYQEQWDTRDFWARLGLILGTNFQNIFEDPVNYYPFDPETANNKDERDAFYDDGKDDEGVDGGEEEGGEGGAEGGDGTDDGTEGGDAGESSE